MSAHTYYIYGQAGHTVSPNIKEIRSYLTAIVCWNLSSILMPEVFPLGIVLVKGVNLLSIYFHFALDFLQCDHGMALS